MSPSGFCAFTLIKELEPVSCGITRWGELIGTALFCHFCRFSLLNPMICFTNIPMMIFMKASCCTGEIDFSRSSLMHLMETWSEEMGLLLCSTTSRGVPAPITSAPPHHPAPVTFSPLCLRHLLTTLPSLPSHHPALVTSSPPCPCHLLTTLLQAWS